MLRLSHILIDYRYCALRVALKPFTQPEMTLPSSQAGSEGTQLPSIKLTTPESSFQSSNAGASAAVESASLDRVWEILQLEWKTSEGQTNRYSHFMEKASEAIAQNPKAQSLPDEDKRKMILDVAWDTFKEYWHGRVTDAIKEEAGGTLVAPLSDQQLKTIDRWCREKANRAATC